MGPKGLNWVLHSGRRRAGDRLQTSDGVMRTPGGRLARMAALALLVAVMSCEREDSRLKNLTVGISKDSAISTMGTKPDRIEQYLVHSQYIQTLFYVRAGKTDSISKALRKMAPIVTINEKVAGGVGTTGIQSRGRTGSSSQRNSVGVSVCVCDSLPRLTLTRTLTLSRYLPKRSLTTRVDACPPPLGGV